MFKLELDWDRPAKNNTQVTTHVLRSRLIPLNTQPNKTLPLHIAIILDISESMAGEKLASAKAACQTIIAQLRDIDKISLASFSDNVQTLLQQLKGGNNAITTVNTSIGELTATGVTRTDLALNWIKNALPKESSMARIGILITDGHPTNSKGFILEDTTNLIDIAEKIGQEGISLCTVGLGNAANFNTSFLVSLSDRGGGNFIYADTPTTLKPQLQKKLGESQAIATVDAKIKLQPIPGVICKGFCHIRPEYLPLAENSPQQLNLREIITNTPTDILIRLEIPPANLGETLGFRDIISIELTAPDLPQPIIAKAGLEYTNQFPKLQQINQEIDNDRLCWDIAIYTEELPRSNNAKTTAELLAKIEDNALDAGQENIASQAAEQYEELKKTGQINPDKTTKLLTQSRNLRQP